MSLGLILVNDDTSLEETMLQMEHHLDKLNTTCSNYIVYTENDKERFLTSLKQFDALADKVYDVTNEKGFVLNLLDQFNILANVSKKGVKISAL